MNSSFFDEGWWNLVKDTLKKNSDDPSGFFYAVQNSLKNKVKVQPKHDKIFRAFKECKYDDVKLVILGQD